LIHAIARLEQRDPTIEEITTERNLYLDATIEEILRTGGTIPMIDWEAIVDTQLLGHHVPKCTGILCLTQGPSFMSPGFNFEEDLRSVSNKGTRKNPRAKPWGHGDIGIFKPERWLKVGDHSDYNFDPAAGPSLAFGSGLRQCYGKRLAYLEMKVLVVLIIWNFKLLPCPADLSTYTSVMRMTSRPRNRCVRLREVKLAG
jgi:cytochrome P450